MEISKIINQKESNMRDVIAKVIDKDGNSLVIEATSELNAKGVCYDEDALRRLVEHNVEERRKNQDILELNKYGARRNYMDKSVPHYLIEDYIVYGGETNLKAALKQSKGSFKV